MTVSTIFLDALPVLTMALAITLVPLLGTDDAPN
jgi:hypothetical protein